MKTLLLLHCSRFGFFPNACPTGPRTESDTGAKFQMVQEHQKIDYFSAGETSAGTGNDASDRTMIANVRINDPAGVRDSKRGYA